MHSPIYFVTGNGKGKFVDNGKLLSKLQEVENECDYYTLGANGWDNDALKHTLNAYDIVMDDDKFTLTTEAVNVFWQVKFHAMKDFVNKMVTPKDYENNYYQLSHIVDDFGGIIIYNVDDDMTFKINDFIRYGDKITYTVVGIGDYHF